MGVANTFNPPITAGLYHPTVENHTRLSGLFPNYEAAQKAVNQLEALGIPHASISVFYRDANENLTEAVEHHTRAAEGAGYGSAVGGTLGAIFGAAIAAAGAITLPGIGLIIAGPIAGALAGAGAGGLTGGLLGALTGAGVPEDKARVYEEGIASGGVVVIADVPDHLLLDARNILDSFTENETL